MVDLLSSFLFLWSSFSDTITHSESLRDGETLVSRNGSFELGFFGPGKSQNRYLGMWYRKAGRSMAHCPGILWHVRCLWTQWKMWYWKVTTLWMSERVKDYAEGCMRTEQLNCLSDGFIKYVKLKLPDTTYTWLNQTMNLEDCRLKCLSNCSCMAYVNSDIRGQN